MWRVQMALNSSLDAVLVCMVSKCSNLWAMAREWEATALWTRSRTSWLAVSLGDMGGGPLGIFSAHSEAVWEKQNGKIDMFNK